MKIKKSELKEIIRKSLLEDNIKSKQKRIAEIESRLKEINENIPASWQEFDKFDFHTSAQDAARKDIEKEFGEEMPDLGDKEDKEEFVSDLERANLKLPSDEKELEKVQKKLDDKKKAKESMRGFSLNEGKDGNYMTPQNLRLICDAAKYLLTVVDEDSEIEDWIENEISASAEKIDSVQDYYKNKK